MKKIILLIIIIIVLGGAYYLISPLFKNIEVDDPIPKNIFEEPDKMSGVSSGFEDLSQDKQEDMLKIMEEVNKKETVSMDEDMPQDIEDEPVAQKDGFPIPVIGTSGHPASGSVRIIQTSDGLVARYENFSTINGPKLHVYLAKDLKAKEFIDLGPIKGTKGNINYVIPENTDLSEYRYIMYWCVPFSVLFNYADLRQ